ncbi:MAG: TetR/AcrR family transcriptional regulator [Gammaproteobacteria bacterium]|nr:TetR/AcrR family transcriptional regulator [Gammaproteobacteria bacterium]
MTPDNTRERIIESARLLVQDASYDGFSFRDIAERVGIRKASIYYHFETKESLAVAMLNQATDGFGQWASQMERKTPIERLHAYCFDFYLARLQAGKKLCPGGAFTAAWPNLGEKVRQAVNRLFDAQHRFVKQALTDASAADSGYKGENPDETASWFIACVQGAIVTARARGEQQLFGRLCSRTLQQLPLSG